MGIDFGPKHTAISIIKAHYDSNRKPSLLLQLIHVDVVSFADKKVNCKKLSIPQCSFAVAPRMRYEMDKVVQKFKFDLPIPEQQFHDNVAAGALSLAVVSHIQQACQTHVEQQQSVISTSSSSSSTSSSTSSSSSSSSSSLSSSLPLSKSTPRPECWMHAALKGKWLETRLPRVEWERIARQKERERRLRIEKQKREKLERKQRREKEREQKERKNHIQLSSSSDETDNDEDDENDEDKFESEDEEEQSDEESEISEEESKIKISRSKKPLKSKLIASTSKLSSSSSASSSSSSLTVTTSSTRTFDGVPKDPKHQLKKWSIETVMNHFLHPDHFPAYDKKQHQLFYDQHIKPLASGKKDDFCDAIAMTMAWLEFYWVPCLNHQVQFTEHGDIILVQEEKQQMTLLLEGQNHLRLASYNKFTKSTKRKAKAKTSSNTKTKAKPKAKRRRKAVSSIKDSNSQKHANKAQLNQYELELQQ